VGWEDQSQAEEIPDVGFAESMGVLDLESWLLMLKVLLHWDLLH